MRKNYRVRIPQLGDIDIENIPQGAIYERNNTNYADGHQEGILYMANGDSYCCESNVNIIVYSSDIKTEAINLHEMIGEYLIDNESENNVKLKTLHNALWKYINSK